ncbi:23980_t:CDS:2 [Cetraspora pellucida]|uniref:23980_t:CDS:1 n=1 Tax=Cetraspora pellucida TaxID=1433469 RepID=A0A9N9AG28_9GLOM|nr:23980_t:CDS:2 [Cetraspora pellucida]
MKKYIEKNIRKCKIAKANGDEFGVVYYKLKNNAIFSKQMENVCKHMRVELLRRNKDKKIRCLASSLLYVGFKAFEEDIIAVHILKSIVTLNKPIYVEQAILDISKTMMFNFWYNDIYKDQAERPDIFDLNYLDDLFLMKNKTKGILIRETVCLKPKIYSVLPAGHDPKTPDNPDSKDPKKKHSIQKAKSIKKSVIKREL